MPTIPQIELTIAAFFGAITGIAVAIVIITLWIAYADAVREWFTELFERGRIPTPQTPTQPAVEVVVSDLHIDTWDYPASGRGSRTAGFLAFVKAIQDSPSVQGFVLNGDIMDIPVFAATAAEKELRETLEVTGSLTEQGVLAARYDDILQTLMTLEKRVADATATGGLKRTLFQTGNHDIGVSGLRFVRPPGPVMPSYLPNIQASWNPQILIHGAPDPERLYDRSIYIEHGHHYDQFLWLYMRYAVLDNLRGGHSRRESRMITTLQRGGRKGMGESARGTDNTAQLQNQVTPQSPPQEKPAMPVPADPHAEWHFADVHRTFGETVAQLCYRHAARRVLRDLKRTARYGDQRVGTVIFGHTHLPDRYTFPDGSVYINSGDWCGHTPHQCYTVIHGDGTTLGPFQWGDTSNARFETAGSR